MRKVNAARQYNNAPGRDELWGSTETTPTQRKPGLQDSDILALEFQIAPNKAWVPLKRSVQNILRFAQYKVSQSFPSVPESDLESELNMILMDRANSYNPECGARFSTWLMVRLIQKLMDRAFFLSNTIHHPYVKGEPHLEVLSCSDENVEDEVDGVACLEINDVAISGHLDALDANEREVLMRITVEGYTVAEVARQLKKPRGWVERQQGRALSRLRKALIG